MVTSASDHAHHNTQMCDRCGSVKADGRVTFTFTYYGEKIELSLCEGCRQQVRCTCKPERASVLKSALGTYGARLTFMMKTMLVAAGSLDSVDGCPVCVVEFLKGCRLSYQATVQPILNDWTDIAEELCELADRIAWMESEEGHARGRAGGCMIEWCAAPASRVALYADLDVEGYTGAWPAPFFSCEEHVQILARVLRVLKPDVLDYAPLSQCPSVARILEVNGDAEAMFTSSEERQIEVAIAYTLLNRMMPHSPMNVLKRKGVWPPAHTRFPCSRPVLFRSVPTEVLEVCGAAVKALLPDGPLPITGIFVPREQREVEHLSGWRAHLREAQRCAMDEILRESAKGFRVSLPDGHLRVFLQDRVTFDPDDPDDPDDADAINEVRQEPLRAEGVLMPKLSKYDDVHLFPPSKVRSRPVSASKAPLIDLWRRILATRS